MKQVIFQCSISDIALIKKLLVKRGITGARLTAILRHVVGYEKKILKCSNIRSTQAHVDHEDELRAIYASTASDVLKLKAEITDFTKIKRCPYCGINPETTSIDHYIAMALVSDYSLCSKNLIPSCTYCNTLQKRAKRAIKSNRRKFIHPYYDKIDAHSFVACTLNQIGMTTGRIVFSTISIHSQATLSQIVEDHFIEMDLAVRYSKAAMNFVFDVKEQRESDIINQNYHAILSDLLAELPATVRDYGTNHWKVPLIKEMTTSVARIRQFLTYSLKL